MLEENKTKTAIFFPTHSWVLAPCRSYPKILAKVGISWVFLCLPYAEMEGQTGKSFAWSCSRYNTRLDRAQFFPAHYNGNTVLVFGHISMFYSKFILILILKGCMLWEHSTPFYFFLLSNVGHFATVLFITNFITSVVRSRLCPCGTIFTKFQIVFWGFSEV